MKQVKECTYFRHFLKVYMKLNLIRNKNMLINFFETLLYDCKKKKKNQYNILSMVIFGDMHI